MVRSVRHRLSGIDLPEKWIPILLDHWEGYRVGFSKLIEFGDEGLLVDGVPLQSSEPAKQVPADADEGFSWQASVAIDLLAVEELEGGATAMVNGREVTGPARIFRQSRLREVSFVALGADHNTRAARRSSAARMTTTGEGMSQTKEPAASRSRHPKSTSGRSGPRRRPSAATPNATG